MVESIEGIDRMQNTSSVSPIKNNSTEKNRSSKSEDSHESINKNELSHDELKEELEEKIDDMNKIMETVEENLSFKLHDKTDRLMTQVIDIKTKEVIKEMPPEEMLDLAAKIHRMVGIIIDEEV